MALQQLFAYLLGILPEGHSLPNTLTPLRDCEQVS